MTKIIKGRFLGMALIAALVIQYVFPVVKLGGLSYIATAIYLVVALLLLLQN